MTFEIAHKLTGGIATALRRQCERKYEKTS
jgi:hypothetical protein